MGERRALLDLFELADDAPMAIARYIKSGTVLVARDGATITGLAMIVVGDGDQVAELKSIAVHPDHRGKGLGRRLVDAVIEHAARAGATRLVVTTASADTGNLRFYQRTGFRMARIVRDFFTAESGYDPGTLIDGIPLQDQVVLDRTI